MHIRSGKQHCLVGTNAFMTTCCSHQSLHASQLTIWKVTSRLTKKCPFNRKSPHKPIERCLPYGVSMQVSQEVPTLQKSTSMPTVRCLWKAVGLFHGKFPNKTTERCIYFIIQTGTMQAEWQVSTLLKVTGLPMESLYAGWLKGAYLMESLHVGWLKGWNGNQAVVQHEFLVQQWSHHCNQYTSLQKNQGSKLVPV